LSCGHSHCPLCQNLKRQLWQAKLAIKFLAVPYVHTVFTVPHQLNTLAKLNKKAIYNITMRAAWKTIKTLSADPKNLGALPGMVAVLHTFGSDMKYHIHVHTLISFGGIDNRNNWQWPKRKNKLAPYRKMCSTYRDTFLSMLKKQIRNGVIEPVQDLKSIIDELRTKRWNVRSQYPTAKTEILERYLARYVNRIAISKSRLQYVAQQEKLKDQVHIRYKDYRKQESGKAAPIALKTIKPLVAIHQFMMHVLPPYFQKSRYYGLHSSATYNSIQDKLPNKLKRNKQTITKMFILLNHMNGISSYQCENCDKESFKIKPIKADIDWIFQFITLPSYRGPPRKPSNAKSY